MSHEPPKVLCVGRTYCDLVFSGLQHMPRSGQETYAEDLKIFAGGGGFITAAYLASAGVNASLCSVVPNGPFGAAIADEMAGSGVDISACTTASVDQQPQVTVVLSSQSDRAFVTRRTGSALPENFAKAVLAPDLTHLHIAELATLKEHPELISLARQNGLTTSLDCAWDEAVLSAPGIIDLISMVDLFMPSEPELLKIANNGDNISSVAQSLAKQGPIVVVKRGPKGAALWDKRGRSEKADAIPTTPIDPTGAGDAFNAGFLVRWLARETYSECLRNGTKFGSAAIVQLGGATAAK